MKLSDLVAYRNALQLSLVQDSRAETTQRINILKHLVESRPEPTENVVAEFELQYYNLQQSFDNFERSIVQLHEKINAQISEEEKQWFRASYQHYERMMVNETTDYILNRTLTLPEEADTILRARLRLYGDWKHPGMIIRPGKENFIQDLVSYDPLYLVDQSHDLLLPALERFNTKYQNRLRSYAVREDSDDPILGRIPDNQFGMCFAYNFFNFRPFEVLRRYLIEIYQKLKPGGVLIMTYNECDHPTGVRMVENTFACYTPGWLLQELAQSIGYTLEYKWSHENEASAWIELRKPGELTSLRGGQSLAKIIPIPVVQPIDTTLAKVYTKEELNDLRQTALELQVGDPNLIRYGYTAEKLQQLISQRRST